MTAGKPTDALVVRMTMRDDRHYFELVHGPDDEIQTAGPCPACDGTGANPDDPDGGPCPECDGTGEVDEAACIADCDACGDRCAPAWGAGT